MNPYKTLPPELKGYSNEDLENFLPLTNEEIRDGGAAMMAYSYLQFTDIHPQQKEAIVKALLRYCELDTMAMVMIWEYWEMKSAYSNNLSEKAMMIVLLHNFQKLLQ